MRVLLWTLVGVTLLGGCPVEAADASPRQLRIGFVAGQSRADLSDYSRPFTDYLSSRVPGAKFQMVRLGSISQMLEAVGRRQIDFVFCSPSAMIELNIRYGLRPIATALEPNASGSWSPWMAGAVFVRRSSTGIKRLEDVRGKRVMALDPLALGGWLAAVREWRRLGLDANRDFAEVRFGGHFTTVVDAVCSGAVDVGVLSAAALSVSKHLCESGFRVLPSPHKPDPRYPGEVSTELYPEIAFAAMADVDTKLITQVTVALLTIQEGSREARAANVVGFCTPLSYAPVQKLMEELRVGPFASYGRLTFTEAVQQHWLVVVGILMVFLIVLAVEFLQALRLNQKLRGAERKLRLMADNLHEAVLAYDMNRRLLYVNPAIEKLTGYSVADLKREHFICWIHPDDRPRMLAYWDDIFKGGSYDQVEYQLVTKDGQVRWAEASWGPLRDKSGRQVGVQGSERDITERKRAEQERVRLESQLQHAQQLESVGRLAGGVAHDFNNLLTVINGYSELLLSQPELDPSVRASVEEIGKAGHRAADLTQQLLAFSRRQVVQPEPLSLNVLVTESEKMLRHVLGAAIDLAPVLDPALAVVSADPGQMHQVLLNLIVNARHAMPKGGRVTIETRNVQLTETDRRDGSEVTPGNYVLLEVRDTGIGMDPEVQARIFDPFFTTKELGQGTGLGLSTVYGIVKQNKGWITVESEPGHGTAFQIYLPGVDGRVPEESVPLQSASALGGPETVLVVEDQAEVRKLAVEVLKSYGYKVLEAAHGEEALSVVARSDGPIDLMVTDVVMPGMMGNELAELLRSVEPQMRVLYTSGYGESVIAQRGVLAPGVEYLAKPFSPEALAAKVREVMGD